MTPPHSSSLADTLTVYLGGTFLVLLVLSAWLPTSCPLLRQAMRACPALPHPASPATLSATQKQLLNVVHQDVTGRTIQFGVVAEDKRQTTKVDFEYWPTLASEVAYLQLGEVDGFHNVALVTAPILEEASTWPSVRTPNLTLFQKSTMYASIDDLQHNLPNPSALAADSVAAAALNLKPNQYTLIDTLANTANIQYVLTTAGLQDHDGSWRIFNQTVDASNAAVSTDNRIEWIIDRQQTGGGTLLHLGTVHVDYRGQH